MFERTRKLAIIGAMGAVVISNPAVAAGEFEAALRETYFESYLKAIRKAGGEHPDNQRFAEEKTKCHIDYVMKAFTPNEVARFDTWVTTGQSPGKELQDRLERRLVEPFLRDVCHPPSSDN